MITIHAKCFFDGNEDSWVTIPEFLVKKDEHLKQRRFEVPPTLKDTWKRNKLEKQTVAAGSPRVADHQVEEVNRQPNSSQDCCHLLEPLGLKKRVPEVPNWLVLRALKKMRQNDKYHPKKD